jgi:hypothetical protein
MFGLLGLPIPGGVGGCGMFGCCGMFGIPDRGGRKPCAPRGVECRIMPQIAMRIVAKHRRKRRGELGFMEGFSGGREFFKG